MLPSWSSLMLIGCIPYSRVLPSRLPVLSIYLRSSTDPESDNHPDPGCCQLHMLSLSRDSTHSLYRGNVMACLMKKAQDPTLTDARTALLVDEGIRLGIDD